VQCGAPKIAKLEQITPITMVYSSRYNYIVFVGFINQVITGGPQKGGKHGKTYSEAWGRFTYKCEFWAKYVVNVVLNIPYMEHMGYKN
jgi:hypothetical protein